MGPLFTGELCKFSRQSLNLAMPFLVLPGIITTNAAILSAAVCCSLSLLISSLTR
jgi:hypothetical protein